MANKISVGTAAIVVAAVLSAALAGTKLESTVTPSTPVARAKNLLVFLVSPDADRRSGWEEVFAGEISLKGVKVTPSYRLFPELPKDREAAVAKVIAEGFDAVLVANLVGQETKVKFHDAETSMQPEYLGQGWWGAYVFTYEQVNLPGYAENKSRAKFKVDLWKLDGAGSSLVWSGTSDSLDPKMNPAAGREVIVSVTKALVKKGLI